MSDDGKPSWRELDQARDRGIKIQKSVSKQQERENKKATQQAKAQLQNLFANSKLTKNKEERIQEIQSLRGKPNYYEKMTAYIGEFGIPMEWEAQLFFLDHKDPTIVVQILDELKKTAPKETAARQELLGQKLKVMELSTFDFRILDKIKELSAYLLQLR